MTHAVILDMSNCERLEMHDLFVPLL